MPRMAHEIRIDGSYVLITEDVREDSPVTITRGRRDQGSVTERGKCAVKLNNRHGKYSEENPLSPYYGKLGLNTVWRTHIMDGLPHCRISGNGIGNRVSTPADPALAITGDLDIRIDFTTTFFPEMLATRAPGVTELIGRYDAAGGGRMYRLLIAGDGTLSFAWSTDGTSFTEAFSDTVPYIATNVRTALRVTLDVDNGAGGNTVTFYQAESLSGTWEQIGNPVVSPGTTSVYAAGSVPLTISDIEGLGFIGLRGRVYGAEVRDGINGAPVANPDFTSLSTGTTSFSDAAGRPWTLTGTASIITAYRRFHGVVPAWPQQWDQSGNDSWTSVEVAGPLRRLDKGNRPVQSTLRKRIPLGNPLAYWPMEDGPRVDRPSSALPNGTPLKTSGLEFASDDSLSGSAALPTLRGAGSIDGSVPGAVATGWHAEMVYNLPSLPTADSTIFRVDFDGGGDGIRSGRLRYDSGNIVLQLLDDDDNPKYIATLSSPEARAALTGAWQRMQMFTATQSGTTYVACAWRNVVSNTWWVMYRSYSGSAGRISRVRASWHESMQGLAVGHLSAYDQAGFMNGSTPAPTVSIYNAADDGFAGETSTTRIRRVAQEELMDIVTPGIESDGTRMGPQPVGTVMDIIRDTEATDGGVLTELREDLALMYRPRASMYNRPVALVLDQAAGQIAAPLDPVKDDQDVVNQMVVTRSGGGSSDPEVLPDSHPLSEVNVGLYDADETYNLYRDEQTIDQAAWRLSVATVDGQRVPTVTLNMMAPGMVPLQQRVLDYLDQQSVIEIRNVLFRPDPVRLIVEGYTERISRSEWTFELNCTPAEPWEPGVWGEAKADSAGSELYTAAGETDTALVLANPGDHPWTDDPSEVPWDIRVGGERMTVTAVSAPAADNFSRTVSNGWGTTSSGGRPWYLTSGGTASDYAVSGGAGLHLVNSLNENRYTLMDAPSADIEMSAATAVSVVPTGAAVQSYLVARMADTSNYYAARVEFQPGGNVFLTLTRIVGGVPFAHPAVQVASGVGASVAVSVLFQALGPNLRAMAWRTGSPMPTTWQVSAVEHDLTARGLCGVRSRVLTGNTNTLPVAIAWDNFELPQTMSVQRSVNGIVKAHPFGTSVRLADPSVVGY